MDKEVKECTKRRIAITKVKYFELGQEMLLHVTSVLQDKQVSRLGVIKLSGVHRILFLGSLLFT